MIVCRKQVEGKEMRTMGKSIRYIYKSQSNEETKTKMLVVFKNLLKLEISNVSG